MTHGGRSSVRCAALAAAAGLLAAARAGAEPKDDIKGRKWEIKPTVYRDEGRRDPFAPLIPLKNVMREGENKLRIVSLSLSSVIVGKRRVAVFKELQGPNYSYILVNGVLIGPDHKPIPGVAGSIEALNNKAEYLVVLKQGADKVEFTQPNWELAGRKHHSSETAKAEGTASGNPSEGGSRK